MVSLRPLSDCCRRGEAEVRILDLLTVKTTWSEFHHLPQSRSKAVVCVSTPRMYPRSGYFLVFFYIEEQKLHARLGKVSKENLTKQVLFVTFLHLESFTSRLDLAQNV